MKTFLIILQAGALLALSGCTAYDPHSEMTPLAGSVEEPTVANRFPASRGGFGLSEADEPHK
jgi:hypothetical protein